MFKDNGAQKLACSRCGKTSSGIKALDSQTKKKLTQKGHHGLSEGKYCLSCISYVMNEAYSTVLEKRVRIEFDRRKKELWDSRVTNLQDAQKAHAAKNFPQAIQNYLSYIRILELVLEIEQGSLEPIHFRTIKGEKEKNVVGSVFFELMKLYDRLANSEDKLSGVLGKLELFVPNCRDGRNLTKLISKFSKSKECIHKKEIRSLLRKLRKETGVGGGGGVCYIASCVYGDDSYEVYMLKNLRDTVLLTVLPGRLLVSLYYGIAPFIVKYLGKNPVFRRFCHMVLDIIVRWYRCRI